MRGERKALATWGRQVGKRLLVSAGFMREGGSQGGESGRASRGRRVSQTLDTTFVAGEAVAWRISRYRDATVEAVPQGGESDVGLYILPKVCKLYPTLDRAGRSR